MAQYLNPYEGIGNALINIGQNYDLDRRRKREAEEDQKRRRADYMWQSKKEEERDKRKYEMEAPEREMRQRIELEKATREKARAVTEALQAQAGKIINLPAGGGSIRQKLDDSGNLVEERIPYVPTPESSKTNWQRAYDTEGNVVFVDPNNPDNRRATDLRGAVPPSTEPTAYQKQQRAQSRLAALQRVESLSNEQIADSIGVSKRDTAAISAERARRRKLVEDTYSDASGVSTAAPASRSFGATAIDSIGQGLMKIGNAVTTTEDSVMADLAAGNITPQEAQAKLSSITGGRTRIDIPGVSIEAQPEAPAPKNKAKEEPEMSYSAAAAMVKAKRPDLTDEQIARYLNSKGITPPKQKKN